MRAIPPSSGLSELRNGGFWTVGRRGFGILREKSRTQKQQRPLGEEIQRAS